MMSRNEQEATEKTEKPAGRSVSSVASCSNSSFIVHHSSLLEQLPGRRKEPSGQIVQEHRQEEVENQDDNERSDESLGGRPADAFRSGPAVVAAMTTDQRNHRSKKHRLDQPGEDVPGPDEFLRMCPVMMAFNVVHVHTDQGAAQDPHDVG